MKILSLHEEKELSLSQRKKYYEQFRMDIVQRKCTNTTLGAVTLAPKLKKVTNKVADAVSNIMCHEEVEKKYERQENIPAGAVIFAHTHQGVLDNFAWIPATPKHCLILHGKVCSKILLMAQLNTGLILVDKNKKENRKNAKLDMIHHLLKGRSIVYFPEGTWNLSPNKLHLPLNYGFVDVARKANVPIVPVVDEYTYNSKSDKEHINKIHIRFGKPIHVSIEDDLENKLLEFSESISTMRYEMMEEKGVFERASISNKDYINYLKGNIRNLCMGKINLDVERSTIYSSQDEFWTFHHINDIPFDKNGNFLDTPEVEKIKRIIMEKL